MKRSLGDAGVAPDQGHWSAAQFSKRRNAPFMGDLRSCVAALDKEALVELVMELAEATDDDPPARLVVADFCKEHTEAHGAALPDAVRGALKLDGEMQALAAQLKDAQSLIFFGRGYNYSTALEAALKVKEVALIHSEGINAGEMKHGPLALVDESLPIVVVRAPGERRGAALCWGLRCIGSRRAALCNQPPNAPKPTPPPLAVPHHQQSRGQRPQQNGGLRSGCQIQR